MKRYLIYVLTLFLELMYFTTQQVSYHSTLPCSVYYCYFLNLDGPFVSHPFIDYLPIFPFVLSSFWLTDIPNYFGKDFDDLFATVTFLLENSSGAVFITTYHNRRYQRIIASLLHLEEVWQATFLINQLHFSTQWSSSD